MKQHEIEQLIDVIRATFKPEVEEPKEGEWIWVKSNNVGWKDALIIYKKDAKEYFGFDYSGEWCTCFGLKSMFSDRKWHYATPSEIHKALTDEWERRGGKKECKFKHMISGSLYEYSGETYLDKDGVLFDSNHNWIFDSAFCEWAEIIEEEKLYVDGNEVEFCDGGVIIKGCWFNVDKIKALESLNPIFGKILKRM